MSNTWERSSKSNSSRNLESFLLFSNVLNIVIGPVLAFCHVDTDWHSLVKQKTATPLEAGQFWPV